MREGSRRTGSYVGKRKDSWKGIPRVSGKQLAPGSSPAAPRGGACAAKATLRTLGRSQMMEGCRGQRARETVADTTVTKAVCSTRWTPVRKWRALGPEHHGGREWGRRGAGSSDGGGGCVVGVVEAVAAASEPHSADNAEAATRTTAARSVGRGVGDARECVAEPKLTDFDWLYTLFTLPPTTIVPPIAQRSRRPPRPPSSRSPSTA